MSRTDIDELHATFVQGMEKKDAALVASVYAADARLLPPGSEALTGPQIQRFWQEAIDSGASGGLETVTYEELGDVAVEEGRYTMQVGGQVVDDGKYVTVHRRQDDGSWKYGLDIFNSSQPEAAAGA